MKKTGNQIYRAHPKSMMNFGDAIDWVDRPKRKAGRKYRKTLTRIANGKVRREKIEAEEPVEY